MVLDFFPNFCWKNDRVPVVILLLQIFRIYQVFGQNSQASGLSQFSGVQEVISRTTWSLFTEL